MNAGAASQYVMEQQPETKDLIMLYGDSMDATAFPQLGLEPVHARVVGDYIFELRPHRKNEVILDLLLSNYMLRAEVARLSGSQGDR